jgi:hypothetical protein
MSSESPRLGPPDLWAVIDRLSNCTPITREGAEAALRTDLHAAASSNEHLHAFAGGHVGLADGVEVDSVRLRVAKEDATNAWLLSLSLSGRCEERATVLARYANMRITQTPRGQSPDEVTDWSRRESWGGLTFGFAERNRDCLSRVLFSGLKW